MMPFVLLSPSPSVLKKPGLYKYCNRLGGGFLTKPLLCGWLCKRLDYKS